jgi:hypothetical protein
MADDKSLEVYRQLRTSQDKYTYFLLAGAASAVALAVNRTTGASLSYWQVPLGLAVLCWGLSFYFGCRHIAYVNSNLYANSELLKVQSGTHPLAGRNPQLATAAAEGITKAMEANSEVANRYGHLQFRLLISGGILYIAYHVLEMARTTVGGQGAA